MDIRLGEKMYICPKCGGKGHREKLDIEKMKKGSILQLLRVILYVRSVDILEAKMNLKIKKMEQKIRNKLAVGVSIIVGVRKLKGLRCLNF